MRIPLYRQAADSHPGVPRGNLGLYYEKFCNRWAEDNQGGWSLGKNKHSWVKEIAQSTRARTGGDPGDGPVVNHLLESQVTRLKELTFKEEGILKVFRAEERFITGMGLEHPVEVGFAWHHTLGVPYLPGSSIKGLVRNWGENWEEDESKRKMAPRIFGGDPAGERPGRGQPVGSVIFFDALPLSPVYLDVDIMTPHYSSYYRGESPPGDWQEPNPIPFLTVAASQRFIFFMAPRQKKYREDLHQAMRWLEEALAVTGAGAKTAVGYGHFSPDPQKEAELQREQEERELEEERQRVQDMPPLEREMHQDGYSKEGEQEFMGAISTRWLDRMESKDTPGEERQQIAALLAGWYQKHRGEEWSGKSKGSRKSMDKIKRIKAALGD